MTNSGMDARGGFRSFAGGMNPGYYSDNPGPNSYTFGARGGPTQLGGNIPLNDFDVAPTAANTYWNIANNGGGPTPAQPSPSPAPTQSNLFSWQPTSAQQHAANVARGNYNTVQNSFIPGLINWNGPGGANPSSREGGNPTALAAKFGMMGARSGRMVSGQS